MTASLGLGTYRMRGVEQAARTACADGSVWIDTAPNYADAHQVLCPVISGHPRAKVATRIGFFTRAEGEAAARGRILAPEQGAVGHSLRVPTVADRIRVEFAHVLDTPAGRIGEQIALAEMLQAVGRGWYTELAPLLRRRAENLTGISPPVP